MNRTLKLRLPMLVIALLAALFIVGGASTAPAVAKTAEVKAITMSPWEADGGCMYEQHMNQDAELIARSQ